MAKATAKIRLTIEVEVDVAQGWGADCTMSQVEKQARDEAKRASEVLADRILNKPAENRNYVSPINVRLVSIGDKITVEIGNEKS